MGNNTKTPIFQLLRHFISTYPVRSLVVLTALLTAGFVETLGIGALLPLLNIVLENDTAEPNILTGIIDSVFSALGAEQNLPNLLLVIVATISLKAFINFQAQKMVAYSAADITNDFRINLIKALMQAKWQYYSTLPVGKSSNAVATEAESAGNFYTMAGKTVASAIQALIYISVAFLIDWKISIAAIIIGFVAAFLLKFLVRIAREAGKTYTLALNNLLSRLNESLSGAKALKAMGTEENFILLLKTETQNIQASRKRLAASSLLMTGLQEPLLVILIAIGLYITYTYTSYPISELLLIVFIFYRLIGYANMIQSCYQKTVGLEAAANSILSTTDKALHNVETMTGKIEPSFNDKISFNNITLGYGDNIICSNLTDSIPAQKITAIFGPSGIGKSTLLDAVLGLIIPQKNDVLIDGVPVSEIDIKKWRSQIGYVPQETFLFHDSILNNVTMGDESISEDAVVTALQKANAWEFIEEIEDGIHHIVGERGGKLSGGQKQRIAMARALVRKPKLLILDEATSGLDKESEQSILTALQKMLPDITVIFISHDPEILNIADHVIKLEKQL